jgi:P-type E1-E2 ATPase
MITAQDRLWWRSLALPVYVAGALLSLLGGLLWLLAMPEASLLWTVGALVGVLPAVLWAAADLTAGRVGTGLFAVPVIVGAVATGQYEAGVAAGLLAGASRGLEWLAWRRARRALTAIAGTTSDRAVRVGERVKVEPGKPVPVDGRLLADAVLDESRLTGDPSAVLRRMGGPVRSGAINAGDTFHLIATVPDTESTWPSMARLAKRAITDAGPPGRLATRAALVFLPAVLVIAAAVWLLTGDPLRALAVLAVAAPGPFLLAGPLALAAGMSRAAGIGVLVGDAGALATLGRARVAVLDSVGVVTSGIPSVTEIVAAPGWLTDEVLALAASIQRMQADPVAGAVVRAAKAAGIGEVLADRAVTLSQRPADASADWVRIALARAALDGANVVWVNADGRPIGAFLVRDEMRAEAPGSMRRLRSAGVRRLVMLTGDRLEDPHDVGVLLGVDEIWTGCGTADKIERVREERRRGPTMMIGDNPAVGSADVGVALSGCGACVADVIIADGDVARLADGVRTARRARRTGLLAGAGGLLAVLAAMGLAALGWVSPLVAVLVQVAVDAAIMGVALCALAPARRIDRQPAGDDGLGQVRQAVREAADDLSTGLTPQAQKSVRRAYHLMADHLVPAQRTGELERQVRRLGTHLTEPDAHVEDMRATLYGLNAVLTERLSSHSASLQRLQDSR